MVQKKPFSLKFNTQNSVVIQIVKMIETIKDFIFLFYFRLEKKTECTFM